MLFVHYSMPFSNTSSALLSDQLNQAYNFKLIWISLALLVVFLIFILLIFWFVIKRSYFSASTNNTNFTALNEDNQNYGTCTQLGQLNDSFLLESKAETDNTNEDMPIRIKSGSLSSLTSITSIISIDTSTVRIKKASLSVNYSICIKNSILMINLISLENIKSVLKLNDCCVYVKLEVMFINSKNVEQKQMAKTRLIRNQSSPVYDELFEFRSSSACDDLEWIRIAFQICNSNSFGRDQLIGLKEHIIYKKDLLLMIHSEPFIFRMFSQCIDLLDAKENFQLGQMHVRLLYKKLTKTLCIHLIKATKLQIPLSYANNDKIPNSFVKVYLLYKGHRVSKKQTKVHENTRNPVYDELLEFDLVSLLREITNDINIDHSEELIAQVLCKLQVFILVMDFDQIEKSDAIGKIELFNINQQHQRLLVKAQHTHENANEGTTNELNCHDWFSIFYQPDLNVLGQFQIKNL